MAEEKEKSRVNLPEVDFPQTMADTRRHFQELKEAVAELPEDHPERDRSIKYIELIDNERDNTGALKRKFFGLEMQALVSRKEMIEELENMKREMLGGPEDRPIPRLEFGEDGEITIPEGENQGFVFVNMGELDRFNKEGGGHEAGDQALMKAQEIFEQNVGNALSKAGIESPYDHFNIYRFDGNTFVASIREIPGEAGKDESEKVREIVAKVMSESGPTVPGVGEPAPLVTTSMELKDAVGLFSDLQAEMEPGKRITDPDQAARELFGMVAGYADHALDVRKFESRVQRVLDKLDEADGDIEAVRPFFENYMKKMFTDTELENIEDFASFDRSKIPQMSLEYARRNLGKASEFEAVQDDAVKRELDRIRARDIVSARVREIEKPEAAKKDELGRKDMVLAEIPDRTNGQEALDALMERYKEVPRGEKGADRIARETAGLEYMIEFARRDQGTGLLERGVYYEELEADIEDEKDVSTVFIDMGFLKYFDKAGGRDVGNNALKFAADLMERAVDDSGIEATVYRYAGDEFTVKIAGGEEEQTKFMASLEKLKHDESGEKDLVIPQGKAGAENGYFPTELVFNAGFGDREMAENVFGDMENAGAFTEADLGNRQYVKNKKAELMTMLADKGIASEKAIGRFELLIGRMNDPGYKDVNEQVKMLAEQQELEIQKRLADGERLSPEEMRVRPETLLDEVDAPDEDKDYWIQTEQMVTYSGKAVFAEDGGANLLRAWAESGRTFDELRDEVETFVEQSIEEAEGADRESRELRDRLVEAYVRADYFAGKVDELQARLDKMEDGNQALSDEIGTLKEMLARAQDEKRQLSEQRRSIEDEG